MFSTAVAAFLNTRMDENIVRLEAWCSTSRKLLHASGSTSSGDCNALLQRIHTHVHRSLLGPDGVAHLNGHTSLVTLPDCILRPILLHADLRDRCALAASCKHLRDRCNALEVLLPTVCVEPIRYWEAPRPRARSLERAIVLARETRPKNLESAVLTWWPELSAGVSRFLAENMARMHSLMIFFPVSIAQHPQCAAALSEALATPAPVLTDLHLAVDARLRDGAFAFDMAFEPLDGQRLGALRRLRVTGMHLTLLPGLVFAELREFCWFHGAPATLDREALVPLVVCMPRLETLHIRARWVVWDHDAPPVQSSLRHVHVDACSQIENLPGFLGGTQIALLTLTRPSSKTSGKGMLDTLARASLSVSYGFLFCEFVARPPGPCRFPQQVIQYITPITPFNVERRRFVASFRDMTSLTLLEFFWPRAQKSGSGPSYAAGPAIALPALTRLCVSLAACRSHRYINYPAASSVLLGLGDRLSPLQTPALRELAISYYALPESMCAKSLPGSFQSPNRGCCCCRTLSVCLSDVHRFVASAIRLPKGRLLELLRVNGVQLVDPDPFVYMELLEQLATIVSVSPVPRPNSCDIGANLREVNDEYLRLDDDLGF